MISIAIVEDEEMYAKQLQQFLHQYEEENKEMFDITVYSDGDQIVNKYKSQYDIILMDVEMKFDGWYVCRRGNPESRHGSCHHFHYQHGAVCDPRLCSGCA